METPIEYASHVGDIKELKSTTIQSKISNFHQMQNNFRKMKDCDEQLKETFQQIRVELQNWREDIEDLIQNIVPSMMVQVGKESFLDEHNLFDEMPMGDDSEKLQDNCNWDLNKKFSSLNTPLRSFDLDMHETQSKTTTEVFDDPEIDGDSSKVVWTLLNEFMVETEMKEVVGLDDVLVDSMDMKIDMFVEMYSGEVITLVDGKIPMSNDVEFHAIMLPYDRGKLNFIIGDVDSNQFGFIEMNQPLVNAQEIFEKISEKKILTIGFPIEFKKHLPMTFSALDVVVLFDLLCGFGESFGSMASFIFDPRGVLGNGKSFVESSFAVMLIHCCWVLDELILIFDPGGIVAHDYKCFVGSKL